MSTEFEKDEAKAAETVAAIAKKEASTENPKTVHEEPATTKQTPTLADIKNQFTAKYAPAATKVGLGFLAGLSLTAILKLRNRKGK